MFVPFRPGSSVLHELSPAAKLGLLALLSTGLFLLDTPGVMVLAALATLALYPFSALPLRLAGEQLRPVAVLGAIIIVVQGLIGGIESAVLVGARLITLVLLAGLVTLTTRTSAMIDTLERALRPLAGWGLNPKKVALALSLAVRFIPMIAQIVAEVREAQRVRGLEHNLLALAIPTLIRTLRLTDEVADAIEARGFNPEQGSSGRPSS